jgi:hypothetical protein
VGEYHTAVADRSDAMEPVGLRDLLCSDGRGGREQRGVFRHADATSRALSGCWRDMNKGLGVVSMPELFL